MTGYNLFKFRLKRKEISMKSRKLSRFKKKEDGQGGKRLKERLAGLNRDKEQRTENKEQGRRRKRKGIGFKDRSSFIMARAPW